MLIPLAIFAGTYLVVAIGRLPGFRVDRTGAAIIGATLMIACDVLTFEEAYRAIDCDTLILLFGMMIVVANLRLSGFFRMVAARAVEHAHRPALLLAAVVFVTGILSAFFVNDTMCLVMTPLVLEVSLSLRRNPVPFLLAVAMGSNIGSVATITGNPQNMLIGSFSRIGYVEFLRSLGPVAVIGLAVATAWIALMYWKEFRAEEAVQPPHARVRVNRVLLWKSLTVAVLMIVGFLVGWPVPKVALVAGAVLLVTRRVKPERVYREIDWQLLVLFTGLFIVVAGVEKAVVGQFAAATASNLQMDRVAVLSAVTAMLSNLVSNVPAVLVMKPFLAHLADPNKGWLVLAMASTLSGNFTILGSVANLIVVERSRREAPISFWEYFRTGAPLTIVTIGIGILWLR